MSRDIDRGESISDLSGVNLFRFSLDQLRENPADLNAVEAERRLSLARAEAERIRDEWKDLLSRSRTIYCNHDQAGSLRDKLSGEGKPGVRARRSIYRRAGSLPKGSMRELFTPPQPAR